MKLKIAYFSPLNPIRSGISDYSEDLLPFLAMEYDIDIYIPNELILENEILKRNFCVKYYRDFHEAFKNQEYVSIVYHMGNNYDAHKGIYEFIIRYPGIVVLHDYSLHHFFAAKTLEAGNIDEYREEMFYCHGERGLNEVNRLLNGEIPPIWETNSLNYPLNLRILDHSAGIIVHSQFAKKMLQEQASYVPIAVVPIPAPYISNVQEIEKNKLNARRELGINSDEFIISTLGYANPTKRTDKIIEALAILKKRKQLNNFKLYIVGEIAPSYPINELIKKHKLNEQVVCTGFVDINEFDKYIAASDLCMNLRFPTQGESSASLLKILGHGKPVVTTNIGSFSEFPNDLVFKIRYDENEVEEIIDCILEICSTNNTTLLKRILEYTQDSHSLGECAAGYCRFIDEIARGNQTNLLLGINDFIKAYIDRLPSELTISEINWILEDNIKQISNTFNKN